MKRFLNALIVSATLFLGMNLFPEYVVINNYQTLVLSVLLIIGMGIIVELPFRFFVWIASNSYDKEKNKFNSDGETVVGILGCGLVFLGIPLLIIANPIKLIILDRALSGFSLNGFWTYIIISLCFIVFNLNVKSKDKTK